MVSVKVLGKLERRSLKRRVLYCAVVFVRPVTRVTGDVDVVARAHHHAVSHTISTAVVGLCSMPNIDGRTLAIVYVNVDGSWVSLNMELLRKGYAEVLYIPPSEFNPYLGFSCIEKFVFFLHQHQMATMMLTIPW